MRVMIIPIVIGAFSTFTKWLVKGQEYFEITERMEIIQTTSFFEIGKNSEKSSGDLKTLFATQTPVENHQQTLTRKTLKEQ